jgi:hypothetical protein
MKLTRNARAALANALHSIAEDADLSDVACSEIMVQLERWRDSRLSMLTKTGLVVQESDGAESSIVRMTIRQAVHIALHAIADHLRSGT